MPRVRVHQHVNPLSPYYLQEPEPVDLSALFADPAQPLHLDVGCARGRFILKMAEAEPAWNFLGVEIREPLVEEANRLASEAGLANLNYVFCNAMLRLRQLLSDVPGDVLQVVTIQFPDPWFKKRHAKRRMVNAELVKAVVDRLASDGQIFIQTDIEDLSIEMAELFREDDRVIERPTTVNLFPVKTERENAVDHRLHSQLTVQAGAAFMAGEQHASLDARTDIAPNAGLSARAQRASAGGKASRPSMSLAGRSRRPTMLSPTA